MSDKDVFVLRDIQSFTSITQSIQKQKLHYKNIVIEQGVKEANYHVSRQLQIPLTTKIFYIKRLRIVEGKPKSIETNYIDYRLVEGFENIDFNNRSFYQILEEETGFHITRSEEEILVVKAKDDECEYLKKSKGSEILFVKGKTYQNESELPLEYFELSCEPSFYRFRSVMKI